MESEENSDTNRSDDSYVSAQDHNYCQNEETNNNQLENEFNESTSFNRLPDNEFLSQIENYLIDESDEEYSGNEFFEPIFATIKCTLCSKTLPVNDFESHLALCMTRPYIEYNEDLLAEDSGECVICLEEMLTNEVIARLPCLCIYHKNCINDWFNVSRSCPQHPSH